MKINMTKMCRVKLTGAGKRQWHKWLKKVGGLPDVGLDNPIELPLFKFMAIFGGDAVGMFADTTYFYGNEIEIL